MTGAIYFNQNQCCIKNSSSTFACAYSFVNMREYRWLFVCYLVNIVNIPCFSATAAKRVSSTFEKIQLQITRSYNSVSVFRIFYILLTHEGSHREVYQELQPSYEIFLRWCQGLFRRQVLCIPSLHCPIANSVSTRSPQPV